MLEKSQNILDRMSVISTWVGGAALLATAFLVGTEVVIRKLFNLSLGAADEISGYVFAIATAWAYAMVLRQKGNVRIDVFYNLFPPSLRLILDISSFLAIGLLLSLIGWYGFELALNSLQLGTISITPLRTPLAIPQFAWISGVGFAFVMWLMILIRVTLKLLKRDWQGVLKLIGPAGIKDEISAQR